MPSEVRSELWRQLTPYRQAHPDVRWTRPPTWHLTLAFLGSVDPVHVPLLASVLETAGHRLGSYRATVDRGGGRVRGREGVAWVGLGEGAAELIAAASLVADGVPPGVVTGAPPRRTPSAHLTVARKADTLVVEALRSQSKGPVSVSWTVTAIELVRSHLGSGGARYETLHRATL